MGAAFKDVVREVAKAVAIAALSELAIEVTIDLYDRARGRKPRDRRNAEEKGSNDSFEPSEEHK